VKITICGSIAFIDEMNETKVRLELLGHEVKIPVNEFIHEGKEISVKDYYQLRKQGSNEQWVWDKKEELMKTHFNKIAWCDAILVLNHDKNGVNGYVGGNTLMEMGVAQYLGKKIYMIKPIPELSYKEEIIGAKPVIINDLNFFEQFL
jgi:hypothetical protein